MWFSLIALKFFLCALALTIAILSIFDLSSCIYKFTEPLINRYAELYFEDDEIDYSRDNDDLNGDYEEEEEVVVGEKAFSSDEVLLVFISKKNHYPTKGYNNNGIPNAVQHYGFREAENERRALFKIRQENQREEIRILNKASALKRNTKRIEDLQWRRTIMNVKAVEDAKKNRCWDMYDADEFTI